MLRNMLCTTDIQPVDGRHSRGRQHKSWKDIIKEWSLLRIADNRGRSAFSSHHSGCIYQSTPMMPEGHGYSINQSIKQAINQNPWRPGIAGVPWQMLPLWWSPIDACPLQCGAMMTSTGPSTPWCYPSTIYTVYLCDAFRPRSPVVWSLAAYLIPMNMGIS